MTNLSGKRAVTKTKLTLRQSHNRGTNRKPKAKLSISPAGEADVAGAVFSHTG